MYDILINMIKTILTGGMSKDLIKILKINPSTNPAYSDIWDQVVNFHTNTIIPIAIFLVVLYFVIDLAESGTMGMNTPEKILSSCIKMLVAIFFVLNSLQLFADLWAIGIKLVDKFSVAFSKIDDAKLTAKADRALGAIINVAEGQSVEDALAKMKFYNVLGVLVSLILPYLLSYVSSIFIMATAYSRLIQLILRIVFAPIGMSDIYTNGFGGAGGRYVKSFFGVALQGALVIVSVGIINALSVAVASTGLTGSTVVSLVGLGVVMKSQSLAREIVGA